MTSDISSQLLKNMFNIQDFSIINSFREDQKIILELDSTRVHICNKCHQPFKSIYDRKKRRLYAGSISLSAIYLEYYQVRGVCVNCNIVSEIPPLSYGKRQYTKSVGSTLIQYTKHLDNTSASKLLGLSKSSVYRIDKESLEDLAKDYLTKVPDIIRAGVDEVAVRKGHKYGTVFINQEDSKVVWIQPDRTKKSYKKMLTFLTSKLKNLEAVSMDFWKAFETGTTELFPYCKIIYDRFHLSKILNGHVENERRIYQKNLSDDDRKRMKKHSRWVLLKRKKNLTTANWEHLEELKSQNMHLFTMYLLKESFLAIFDAENDRDAARQAIYDWYDIVIQTKYSSLKSFAKRVLKRLNFILNWFEIPISNGKSEGVNNVIKTLLKRAYGYKDFNYFRLKVLQKCGYLMNE